MTIGQLAISTSYFIDPDSLFQAIDFTTRVASSRYYVRQADTATTSADSVHRLPIATDGSGNITATVSGGFRLNSPVQLKSDEEIDAGGWRAASASLIGKAGLFLPCTISGTITLG